MTQSLSGQEVHADHPAAPTSVPLVGEGQSALTGESAGRSVGHDRPMPPTTFPRSADEIADRLRAVVLTAVRPGWPGRVLYALATLPIGAFCLALYFALLGSVVAVVYGIGLLLVPLVLATIRGFVGMERELIRTLLAIDLPVGERVRRHPGVLPKARRLVASASRRFASTSAKGCSINRGARAASAATAPTTCAGCASSNRRRRRASRLPRSANCSNSTPARTAPAHASWPAPGSARSTTRLPS